MTVFRRKLRLHLLAGAALAVAVVWVAAASAAGPVTIVDPADCLPGAGTCPGAVSLASTQAVAGSGNVTTIAVKLNGLGLPFSSGDNIDLQLTAPSGATAMLFSDAGSFWTINSPINITISTAGAQLPCDDSPDSCPATSFNDGTTYAAGDYDSSPQTENNCASGPFQFENDAGDQVPGGALSAFIGTAVNGTWTLTAADDCGQPGGNDNSSLQNWCLVINGTSYGCQATSVSVLGLSARRLGKTARVSWRTAQETSVAGFNVYRIHAGKTAKVNKVLVRARNAARGASYAFTDRTAKAKFAYRYRLQIVGLDGARRWAASTRLRAG